MLLDLCPLGSWRLEGLGHAKGEPAPLARFLAGFYSLLGIGRGKPHVFHSSAPEVDVAGELRETLSELGYLETAPLKRAQREAP